MHTVPQRPSQQSLSRRHVAWLWLLPAAGQVLLGCAGSAPNAPPEPGTAPATAPAFPAPPPSADARAAVPAALAAERQWLQSWFQGTPVWIAQGQDGALSIDVPREFSFDSGKSTVKPALAAVLSKVAESMRRVPLARITLLAAPQDGSVTAPLATQRAAQVQKHLISSGVPAARLARPTVTSAAAVQLRMEAAAP
jgi:outer membrane protein OmpA-like peptidoglycan-associated protein